MTAAQTRETFTIYEDQNPNRWKNWAEAINANAKGLAKIGIEAWRGRGGYTPIAELGCTKEGGKELEAPGDVAEVDGESVAAEAYRICERHHRSHALGTYRIQLYHVKKKGSRELNKGEAVALRFGEQSANEPIPMDISDHAMRALLAENKSLREHNDRLLGRQVDMAQAATGVMMTGMATMETAARERASAADHYASTLNRASPADWNYRVWTVADTIDRAASRLAPYLGGMGGGGGNFGPFGGGGPPPPPPNGGPPPTPPGAPPPPNGGASSSPHGSGASTSTSSTPPGPVGQAAEAQMKCRAVFDNLSGEQKDALRDRLPPGFFVDMCASLHGAPADFMQDAPVMGTGLHQNFGVLMQVLTPEQLTELRRAMQ